MSLGSANETEPADLLVALRVLLAGTSPELRDLYAATWAHAKLSPTDFATICDLVELSGCVGEEILALLLVQFLALEQGSLCLRLSHEGLTRVLSRVVDAAPASAWAVRLEQACRKPGAFAELLGRDGEVAPLIRVAHRDGDLLYFQKYHRYGQTLVCGLRSKMAAPIQLCDGLEGVLREVLVENPLLDREGPLAASIALSAEQQTALGLALTRNLTVISGGPGTGKTFLIFTLLRCLVRLNLRPEELYLAAPTGRAARRIKDFLTTGLRQLRAPTDQDARLEHIEASTLHGLLGYRPSDGTFRHHAYNPLRAQAVIVDEVSMVDVALMARLLEALPLSARLILLGDKDQLPPVGVGAVLATLIPGAEHAGVTLQTQARLKQLFPQLPPLEVNPRSRDAVALLRENFRSQSHIRELAARVNAGDVTAVDLLQPLPPLRMDAVGRPAWPTVEGQGCWKLEAHAATAGELQQVAEAWWRSHYGEPLVGERRSFVELVRRFQVAPELERESLLTALFDVLEATRILTAVRRGPYGCEELNARLLQLLRVEMGTVQGATGLVGAPLMVTRNDPVRGLFNGDVGVVLAEPDGRLRAAFRRSCGHVLFGLETLPQLEGAFATTVHKGQGSEYRHVLFVLPPDERHALLSRELVYTAITRAKEQVTFYGTSASLRKAVATFAQRESGAELWG